MSDKVVEVEEVVDEEVVDEEVLEDERDEGTDKEEQTIPLSELKRRLARQQEKFEEQLRLEKVEAEKQVKKAKMTQAEQRAFDLDNREKELRKLEAELKSEKLRTTITSKLADRGLSNTYTDLLVVLEDEELIDLKIEEIKKGIEDEVNSRLKGKVSHAEPKVEGRVKVKDKSKLSKKDIFSN